MNGTPRGSADELIRWANKQNAPILALDNPSGLDVSTGLAYSPSVWATATMTLALPKRGLFSEQGMEQSGELYLADISVPPQLYSKPPLSLDVSPLFAGSEIIRIY